MPVEDLCRRPKLRPAPWPRAERAAYPRLALFLLLALCCLLFFPALDQRDLTASHEARAAMNAHSILSEGCWGLPRLFDERPELQKPPLYYWLVALAAQLQGGVVDAWAVRLPPALSALGCVLLLFLLGCRTGQPGVGFCAGLILATSVHFTWLARVGRIDMPLTFMVTAALVGLHLGRIARGRDETSWPWFLMAYVAAALGLLLKGPIAGILMGLVGIVGKIINRRAALSTQYSVLSAQYSVLSTQYSVLPAHDQRPATQAAKPSSLWWGLPLVAVLAGPWYLWANLHTHNRFWEVFVIHHNFERGLGGSDDLAGYPIWYYLPRLLVDGLPWTLALPLALWLFVRRGWWRDDGLARMGLGWLAAMFALLSCMSFKRADYLLPAYPGLALFLGAVLWRAAEPRGVTPRVMRPVALALFAIVYVAGWLLFHVHSSASDKPYQRLAQDIRNQTRLPVIFFRAEEHCLAFHLGRPVATVLEWENLDVWAGKREPVFVVMPEHCASARQRYLSQGDLHEVASTRNLPGTNPTRPVVILRTSQPAPARID